MKLADDVASRRALPRVAANLEPQQQGLNPTGLSKVIRCLRGWARQAEDNAAADPDAPARTILPMDFENAFCRMTRSRALNETSLMDAHLAHSQKKVALANESLSKAHAALLTAQNAREHERQLQAKQASAVVAVDEACEKMVADGGS